jgi:hypothetical protein
MAMDGTSHHQSNCQWSHIMCCTAPIIGSSGLVTGQGCACAMLQSKGTAGQGKPSPTLHLEPSNWLGLMRAALAQPPHINK